MRYCLSIIHLFLAINVGIAYATPSPPGREAKENRSLNARAEPVLECDAGFWGSVQRNDVRIARKADWLKYRFDIYDRQCFFTAGGGTEGGVNADEFVKFWATKFDQVKSTDPEVMEYDYTLVIEPGGPKCEQVWCIGDHASLRVCDLRSDEPPYRSVTWSAKQLYGALLDLHWAFWPKIQYTDMSKEKMISEGEAWVREPKDLGTCCVGNFDRGAVPKTSDRFWGTIKQKNDDRIQITIEPTRPGQGNCDPSKNLVPYGRY
ncbi:hypothetical protein TWF281_002758 [Arthrobotrys megalospora]